MVPFLPFPPAPFSAPYTARGMCGGMGMFGDSDSGVTDRQWAGQDRKEGTGRRTEENGWTLRWRKEGGGKKVEEQA